MAMTWRVLTGDLGDWQAYSKIAKLLISRGISSRRAQRRVISKLNPNSAFLWFSVVRIQLRCLEHHRETEGHRDYIRLGVAGFGRSLKGGEYTSLRSIEYGTSHSFNSPFWKQRNFNSLRVRPVWIAPDTQISDASSPNAWYSILEAPTMFSQLFLVQFARAT